MLACHVAVMMAEVVLLPMMTEELMPVAIKAESLLRALAGMHFVVAAPLLRRAWACVPVMLFGFVHFLLVTF